MNAAGTRLAALTKDLWVRWQETKQYWDDAQSREFESKYMQELVSSVDRAMVVIEELDKAVSKIRRDCE